VVAAANAGWWRCWWWWRDGGGGGGSVTPQVFSRVINPNDLVNCVDFGQTTVNLGHHLENITDNP
jgi:hypothetical protein